MDIINSGEVAWRGGPSHRDGDIKFKDLFAGDPALPNNYWLALVRVETYEAPPHRHNFDQVRFMLDGGFGFGGQIQDKGTVGYFAEGVTYTQKAIGENIHLLLQCEGGNRAPFFSQAQLREAVDALKTSGEFIGGRYRTGTADAAVERDGFEAAWEYLAKRPIAYSVPPRFQQPVIIEPAAFAWTRDPAADDVYWRCLGQFTERAIEFGFARLEADANASLSATDVPLLAYVTEGEGTSGAAGAEASWQAGSAIRLAPHEVVEFTADTASEIFYIRLPR